MSDSTRRQKADLREDVKAQIDALGEEERHARSATVCRRVAALEAFKHAATVMMYMPLPKEVDVTPLALLCFQRGKTVCVPQVDWSRKEIRATSIQTFDDRVMDVDEHGLRVPREGELVIPSMIDLVIIPGLAFDAAGNRLGRGGGFYDRFLTRTQRAATKVAVAFDVQVVDEVPMEEQDIAVDILVTDRRTTHAGQSSLRR